MKNSQKGFTSIILVFVAILVIAGGIYIYQKNQATPQTTPAINKNHIAAGINTNSGSTSDTWIASLISVSQPVNRIKIQAGFIHKDGAEGLLSVYWDGKLLESYDERNGISGSYHIIDLPSSYNPGVYTLAFRLDSFSSTPSSGWVNNIEFYNSTSNIEAVWNNTNSLTTSPAENSIGELEINSKNLPAESTKNSDITFIDNTYYIKNNQLFYAADSTPTNADPIIQGADIPTFRGLGSIYSKDQKSVYFNEYKIVGADPQTFTSNLKENIYNSFSKDKDFVYDNGQRESILDVSTFQIIDPGSEKDCGYGPYLKDKNGVYEYVWDGHTTTLTRIEGVDTATFKAIGAGYSSDKNHVYKNAKIEPNLDPNIFKAACGVGGF
jgi:hypothetical protein